MVNAVGGSEDGATQEGPYILACPYCNWSSAEIGMEFHKPNNITGQLANLKKGGSTREHSLLQYPVSQTQGETENEAEKAEEGPAVDEERRFANLKSFYTAQLSEPSPAGPAMDLGSAYGYGSPGTLSRIMGLYTGMGGYGAKKAQGKSGSIREARDAGEGLQVLGDEDGIIRRMRAGGWDETTNWSQRSSVNRATRFVSDLRPVATLLRTKRSKRCRTCRHILVKPESKVPSTRFRIRLVAANYLPSITLSTLSGTPLPPTLQAFKTTQTLLTFKNPLFETIHVTLATPTQTPSGPASKASSSKVTVLCPQFSVGANTDVWDEALSGGGSG
ncbi:MAG: hypothetical protein M1838_005818, partial [Thelocarpon superellum]